MNQTNFSTGVSIEIPDRPVRELEWKPGPPISALEARSPCQPLTRLIREARKNQRAEEVIWLLLAASAAALVVLSLWI